MGSLSEVSRLAARKSGSEVAEHAGEKGSAAAEHGGDAAAHKIAADELHAHLLEVADAIDLVGLCPGANIPAAIAAAALRLALGDYTGAVWSLAGLIPFGKVFSLLPKLTRMMKFVGPRAAKVVDKAGVEYLEKAKAAGGHVEVGQHAGADVSHAAASDRAVAATATHAAPAADLSISFNRARAAEFFEKANAAWTHDLDPDRLRPMFEKVSDHGLAALTPDDKIALKAVRKSGSVLRDTFEMGDVNHEIPKELQSFVADFGHFNDAFEGNLPGEAKKYAKVMLDHTRNKHLRELGKDVADFEGASKKSMSKYMGKTLDRLHDAIEVGALPAEEFHEVRKELKLFLNLFNLERADHATPAVERAYQRLFVVNEDLGKTHDALVYQGARGEIDYAKAKVTIPPEVRVLVDELRAGFHII
jgi:hypothetical protein